MSTFTNWNGPQCGGSSPAASDWRELIQNYKDAITALGQKQDKLTFDSTPVAGSQNPVTSAGIFNITSQLQEGLTNLLNLLSRDYETKEAAASKYQTKLPDNLVTQPAMEAAIAALNINQYLKTNDLADTTVIQAISEDIITLQAFANSDTMEKPTLIATDYIIGMIKATEQIQFTDKVEAAYIGGSDLIGVYYILGMLAEKAGTAYIKYRNESPFSAVVNFAVTPGWKGALSVTTDSELKGLKFKIVKGTDRDGIAHAYLAIQSTEWIPQFSSTDGKGMFSAISFDAAGINFYPVGSKGFIQNNAECETVCDCNMTKGFGFSELGTTVLNAQIYREKGNPYLSYKSVKALDAVGIQSFWPEWDEETALAINVPEGYHACDGTPVLDTDEVDDEFREKFTEYPLVDYAIIKTQSTIKLEDEILPDPEVLSLANSIAKLHGIKLYMSLDMLPDEAKIDEPAIVKLDDNSYAVYKFNGTEWEMFSTTFNDVNKTVEALATIMSSLHGSNVYTVYNSVDDLPIDINVETGSFAIVISGSSFTVYKYNGTEWEAQ